jgi:hypothetical protein
VIKLARHDEMRHELVDAQGAEIMLVVSDAKAFMGADPIAVAPDQAEAFPDAPLMLPPPDRGNGEDKRGRRS